MGGEVSEMTTFTTDDRIEASYCCHKCFKSSGGTLLFRMILCGVCGNKRCPKASDHDLQCTSSNEPGQEGSVY